VVGLAPNRPEPGVNAPECSIDPSRGFFAVLNPGCNVQYLEQFRLLRTQLLLHRARLGGADAFRAVSVMSSEPGEGKSFTASNLACVLAGTAGQNVLLIDANPQGRALPIGVAAEGPGLRSALESPNTWRGCVRRVPDTSLLVMPRGMAPASGRPWNLEPLPALLEELTGYFEWIVLDGASFRTSPEAPWLASISDGTLLVVQGSAAGFGAVRDSLERIPGDRLAGVVFNQQKPQPKPGFRLKLRIRR
jgi:Mrp family chromosome partitioning ATPase